MTIASSSTTSGVTTAIWTLSIPLTTALTTRGKVKLTFDTVTNAYDKYGETTGKLTDIERNNNVI